MVATNEESERSIVDDPESLPYFASPIEDTSGLDVFAQIAASANPLPLEPVRRNSQANAALMQQSQNQMAQTIYQQRMQLATQASHQARSSSAESDSDFDDDYDEELDFMKEEDEHPGQLSHVPSASSSSFRFFDPNYKMTIKEESETELQAADEVGNSPILAVSSLDSSMDSPRRRAPSLTPSSHSLIRNSNPLQPSYSDVPAMGQQRRLSAPQISSPALGGSGIGGFSNRRVIHNICERKRRENIRDGFAQLQARLHPSMASNPKISKMDILQGALKIIRDSCSQITTLDAEIEALEKIEAQILSKAST